MTPHTPPAHRERAFNCPYCSAFANMEWYQEHRAQGGMVQTPGLETAECAHCGKYSIWFEGRMILPDQVTVPPPNADLNEEIQRDYLEAASILDRSPRGAVALLRLAIQKICRQLGQPGENLNNEIAALVQLGSIPPRVQQALDVVRVIGNNAVHPGQIDLRDDRAIGLSLFLLVNLIAERAITQPKEVEALYNALPDSAREQIERRDKSPTP